MRKIDIGPENESDNLFKMIIGGLFLKGIFKQGSESNWPFDLKTLKATEKIKARIVNIFEP